MISFEYDPNLVSKVKQLPGRQYDPNEKIWFVPVTSSQRREEVLQFGKENYFFISLKDDNHYTNNPHFFKIKDKRRSTNMTFCEGRKAIRKEYDVLEFWWCHNQKCFDSCHGPKSIEEWKEYTVEDFLRGFDLNVDEHRKDCTIEMGQYQKFLGWVNRFESILKRMYCRECDEVLKASHSSNYAYYRVTEFECTNQSCSKRGEVVYLHHCLNGKCGSIIDSRDSAQCENGWYICTNEECGCCCSHEAFVRRHDNLLEVGKPVPKNLKRAVEKKLGHRERGVHFCYECGEEMEARGEIYECPEGHVTYDLTNANFDRPHKHLEESDGKSMRPPRSYPSSGELDPPGSNPEQAREDKESDSAKEATDLWRFGNDWRKELE